MRRRLTFSVLFFIPFFFFHFLSFAQDIQFNLVTRSKDDIGSLIQGNDTGYARIFVVSNRQRFV
jgi:hypothetical protein